MAKKLPENPMYSNNYSVDASQKDGYEKIVTVSAETNIITDVATKGPFGRGDYDSFRPQEAVPRRFEDIIRAVRSTYIKVGVVRQVIDLMTDFACENIKFVHPDKKVEIFLNVWAKKVGLRSVCEEFARHYLLDCNVVVKRTTSKLTSPVEKQWEEEISSNVDVKMYKETEEVSPREIPIRYNFLNILNLRWTGGDSARFTQQRTLNYMASPDIISIVKNGGKGSKLAKSVYENLPNDFKESANKSTSNLIPLDMSKIHVAFNKKDDWDIWATPFLVAVLADVIYKDKLRLADNAALDGVINFVRLWKLGDHNAKDGGIFPGSAAFSKLSNILQTNTGGGAIDIIWDSLIDMEAFYPPVDKILGSEKYDQVNQDILIGLGVPDVLLGGKGSNFSNSSIQLKTIIQRIKSIRQALTDFLEKEVTLVCKAFGFTSTPSVEFPGINSTDENITKQLLIQLFDRGLISDESLLEDFDEDPAIEVERIKRQKVRQKAAGIKVQGPFVPDPVTPGSGNSNNSNPSRTGGRPSNGKDVSRKPRKSNPKASEDIVMAIDKVSLVYDVVSEYFMANNDVSNLRKLTGDQRDSIDSLITVVLSCIDTMDVVTPDYVVSVIQSLEDRVPNKSVIASINGTIDKFVKTNGIVPTLNQKKHLQALAWINGDDKNEDDN